jgi:GT2 family glycosyltransferase
MMDRPVWVVIVNFRTPTLAIACLASIEGMVADLHRGGVVVVDNHSADGSAEQIGAAIRARGWGEWAELLAMPRNGGFADGNNAGLRRALARDPQLGCAILLNPDTIVAPHAFDALLRHLDSNSSVGIAGARIVNENGRAETSAHRLPSPLGELENAAQFAPLSRMLSAHAVSPPVATVAHPCDWVSGACMAIRREVLDAVGPLDEGYFLYFEEVDFCLRAKQAGWGCAFVPEACVTHLEGASTGIAIGRRRRPSYWYESRRRFFVKAYGLAGLLWADVLWAFGRGSLSLRRALGLGGKAGADREPSHLAIDLLWGDLKAALSGEWRTIQRLPRRLHAG